MKKLIPLIILIPVVLVASWYFFRPTQNSSSSVSESSLTTPERQAEINGYVISIEGNQLTIANELGLKQITDEEKARRQQLTQEERQALKLSESSNVEKQNLNITIPVGTLILKGSGDASGSNLKSVLSEIRKGVYLSIWQSNSSIEVVKVKGVSE